MRIFGLRDKSPRNKNPTSQNWIRNINVKLVHLFCFKKDLEAVESEAQWATLEPRLWSLILIPHKKEGGSSLGKDWNQVHHSSYPLDQVDEWQFFCIEYL